MTSVRRYTARELASTPVDVLWEMPSGIVEVEFDPDETGHRPVIRTTMRRTIFSATFWVFALMYPKVRIRPEHHLGTKQLNNRSHMDVMNTFIWDIVDTYGSEIQLDEIEELSRLAYQLYNVLYNQTTVTPSVLASLSTVSILHMIEIADHPEIKAAIQRMDDADGTLTSLHQLEAVASKVLMDPKEVVGNPVKGQIATKPSSITQVRQCVIARGQQTELDSRFFDEPIPSSFLSGMNSLTESMMESCTSKKATAFKEEPIEKSEYFNRRVQLMAGSIYMREGDCGTHRTVRWFMSAKDLPFLAGQNQVIHLEDGNELIRPIRVSDKHLIGKAVHIRNVTKCDWLGTQCVCSTCYGELYKSIPRGTNVGQVAATAFGDPLTTLMLQVKHVDVARGAAEVEIGTFEREYLQTMPGTRYLKFRKSSAMANAKFTISPSEAVNLSEIANTQPGDAVYVSRISDISEIILSIKVPNAGTVTSVAERLVIQGQGRPAHFTKEILEHIRTVGYHYTDTGRFQIDLKGFDLDLPVFEVPNHDENSLVYLGRISKFLISESDRKGSNNTPLKEDVTTQAQYLRESKSIEEALTRYVSLVASKMTVNLTHLSVLVASTMVRSLEDRDYRPPFPGNKLQFGKLNNLIMNRSMSAATAFEMGTRLLLTPFTYVNRYRIDHPLDDILMIPREQHPG